MSNKAPKMSQAPLDVVREVSQIVSQLTGVQLGDKQQAMVKSRLAKRISDVGLTSEEEYFEFLKSNLNQETQALVSLLTTHHTYFFREFPHFEFLATQGLQALIAAAKKRGEKTLRFWSAASSRGQEAYSLAMFLSYHLPLIAPGFGFEILGTDVDTESVEIAKNGVYLRKEVQEIPLIYFGNHWAKGTGEIENFVKAKSSLKSHCQFEVKNLLSPDLSLSNRLFDAIFCRNVFIYFNSSQIKEVTSKLLKQLHPQGLMFIGISESLYGMDLPLTSMGPSIFSYQTRPKLAEVPAPTKPKTPDPTAAAPAQSASAIPNPLRVVCVDDSPSILKILENVLSRSHGFEVVATAKNGIEAQKKIEEFKPHVVTLDIHMPEQNGVDYLSKNFSRNHPPVVMITSVSRDEMDLGLKALNLGASDYVEKPALSNMAERGDEIRTKLRCAYRTKQNSTRYIPSSSEWGIKSGQDLKHPGKALRLIVASLSDQAKLKSFFNELKGVQPPTVIFIEGAGAGLPVLEKTLSTSLGRSLVLLDSENTPFEAGKLYVGDLSTLFKAVREKNSDRPTSVIVFGEMSEHGAKTLAHLSSAHLIVEEGTQKNLLVNLAAEVVPSTSFAYLSHQFFETREK
jgi:chemotaxis protein methyltransferase CheR